MLIFNFYLLTQSDAYPFPFQIFFKFGYLDLAKVEDACCESGVCMTKGECVAEMLSCTGSATGDDGYGQSVCASCQRIVGKSRLHAVVVH